jgi:hypothetical protein
LSAVRNLTVTERYGVLANLHNGAMDLIVTDSLIDVAGSQIAIRAVDGRPVLPRDRPNSATGAAG